MDMFPQTGNPQNRVDAQKVRGNGSAGGRAEVKSDDRGHSQKFY